MESIEFLGELASIGIFCFDQCFKLSSVVLPRNVTSIGQGAFRFCYNLKYFFYWGDRNPTHGENVFTRTPIDLVYDSVYL